MPKKILIISPHFPPINAPDHQRVRMMLPYLTECGWQAHILAVKPDSVQGVMDPFLSGSIPKDCQITYTDALPIKYTRLIGIGTLGWRCLPFIFKAGSRLLKEQKFDLILFSTTVFQVFSLGPPWLKKFGVPYIIDLQDPWLSPYQYKDPPGGKFKYGAAQFFARIFEPPVMKDAAAIITVSPEYPKMLLKRYPFLNEDKFSVVPFGAPQKDFELLPSLGVRQDIFDPQDGKQHWVYVGRGGSDMAFSLRGLFSAVKTQREKNPGLWKSIRLHFIGTSYASRDRAQKTVEPIAQESGVGDLVEEYTTRVPYFEALKILCDSHCIMVIGSDDPAYTASKIFPYILAQKPLLAIFHEQSSAVRILNESVNAQVAVFDSSFNSKVIEEKVSGRIDSLLSGGLKDRQEINWNAFNQYTAFEMTRRLCGVFQT